jgi:hypothetical protein
VGEVSRGGEGLNRIVDRCRGRRKKQGETEENKDIRRKKKEERKRNSREKAGRSLN